MKKRITLGLVLLMVLSCTLALCACGGSSAAYVFKGQYQPQQMEDAEPVEFVLTLKEDGTLEVTPGIMFSLDDKDATKIVVDGIATGTWSKGDDESLTMVITAAGDSSFSMEYTMEKLDGYYEFDMMLDLTGYKRPTVMTSE